MKKFSVFCLAFALAMVSGPTLFAGGQSDSQSTQSGGKVKISLWHSFVGADQRAEFMEKRITAFKAANPDIEIDEQKIPRDQYQTKLKTLAAAGELPDAFLIWPNAMTKEFSSAGLLADINGLLAKEKTWKDSLLPRALEEFTFGGKTYSAGLGVSVTSILYYNKALFAANQVKVPTTYDELKTAIKTFSTKGIIPVALGNKAKWPVQSTIFSVISNRVAGTKWLEDTLAGKGAKFTDKAFVDALGVIKELTDLGAFNRDYNSIDEVQMRSYFYKGEAAMVIGGSWVLPDMIKNSPEELKPNIEMTVFPSIPGGAGDPKTMSGVSSTGIAVNAKASPQQRAAIEKLIMFLTNNDAQELYTQYFIPISSRAFQPDASKLDALYVKLVKLIKDHPLVTVYDSALNSEQTDIINNGLQAVMLGTQKPAELAAQLQTTIK